MTTRDDLIELLRELVSCSDANDGESLMNVIEHAREILEDEEVSDDTASHP